MNNIDIKEITNKAAEFCLRYMTAETKVECNFNAKSFEKHRPVREAITRAVIEEYQRLMREQAGEGMPSVEKLREVWFDVKGDCRESWTALHKFILDAFARKMEAVAKLPERWRADQNGAQSVITVHGCAYEVERALQGLAVEAGTAKPVEKWAAEKAALAQGKVIQYSADGHIWTEVMSPGWINGKFYRIAPVQPAKPDPSDECKMLSQALSDTREKLAAAESRLALLAELPKKWKSWPTGQGFKSVLTECANDLEEALSPSPSAESVSRAEFEAWAKSKAPAICYDLTRSTWSKDYEQQIINDLWTGWQAARNYQP